MTRTANYSKENRLCGTGGESCVSSASLPWDNLASNRPTQIWDAHYILHTNCRFGPGVATPGGISLIPWSPPEIYSKVTDEYVAHVCALLIHEAERIEIRSHLELSTDPGHSKFMELAVDGAAAMIVSGDKTDFLSEKNGQHSHCFSRGLC